MENARIEPADPGPDTPTGSRIRPAALRLFARHGYAAVSMRQIAAEVGVQAGALYLYIPDKQSLLFGIVQAHLQAMLSAWRGCDPGGAAPQRLESFVRCHLGFGLDHPDEAVVAAMELRNLDPQARAEADALRAAYEAELEAILREGAEAGAMRVPDTGLVTVAVLGMLDNVRGRHGEGARLSRERLERICWNMVRRAVGA